MPAKFPLSRGGSGKIGVAQEPPEVVKWRVSIALWSWGSALWIEKASDRMVCVCVRDPPKDDDDGFFRL